MRYRHIDASTRSSARSAAPFGRSFCSATCRTRNFAEQITRATNKAAAYNGYTRWLHFGGDGYLRSRDPELQEKAVKFLVLIANSIIFSTAVDMTDALRQMLPRAGS
ncbi:Tn3 family transposase [Streptomyces sp. NPDC018057]|uniref:Tn3 family transposase n=1 Tax=unclassified Streptomyces TaxID=2593676 RepID=UPI0037AD6047